MRLGTRGLRIEYYKLGLIRIACANMRCNNAIELIKTTKREIPIMLPEEIKEYIGTQLKALTSIASPTGFTKNATDYLMKQLEAMGYAPQLSY